MNTDNGFVSIYSEILSEQDNNARVVDTAMVPATVLGGRPPSLKEYPSNPPIIHAEMNGNDILHISR